MPFCLPCSYTLSTIQLPERYTTGGISGMFDTILWSRAFLLQPLLSVALVQCTVAIIARLELSVTTILDSFLRVFG